jgi:hypothetical protein
MKIMRSSLSNFNIQVAVQKEIVEKRRECGFTSETLYLITSSKSLKVKIYKIVILHVAL